MPRFFNHAGPCKRELHYMLPAAARIPGVHELVDTQSYFVLHAPRQSGKTTAILELAAELTASGRYAAAVLSVEVATPFDDIERAERALLGAWPGSIAAQVPPGLAPREVPALQPGATLMALLRGWSLGCPRPVVVFLDEVDGLAPEVLASLLRQVRNGFPERPRGFPHALALVGMRDVRDYAILSGGSGRLGAGSPFNIKAESVTLAAFTRAEIATLYTQHTAETGQAFTPDAVDAVFLATAGQPWLVNALAREAIRAQPTGAIEPSHIDTARERLVRAKVTHLDSLSERLREPRIRRVIEPMIAGTFMEGVTADDLRYVQELGLVRVAAGGGFEMANPIYREVVPRALTEAAQLSLPSEFAPSWRSPDGRLSPDALMAAFIAFWRQHGGPLMRTVEYHEVAPQLVLMAFLHRAVNGGATIDREYAVGTGRLDLCVRSGTEVMAVELKIWRDGEADPLAAGLVQLDRYLERLGQSRGWLVVFDRRTSRRARRPADGVTTTTSPSGRTVEVVRLT